MKKRLIIIGLLVALCVALIPVAPVMADTSEGVTVTATPAYVSMTDDPDTWTLNDLVGDGVTPKGTIAVSSTYYSNPLGDGDSPSDPVVDGECRFTVTNTSTITTDLFVVIGDFTGGNATMANSDDGTADTDEFGAFSYCSGMTYSTGKVICKTTGSDATKEDLAPTTDIKWGLTILTRTNAWSGGGSSTATATVSLAPA